MKEKHKKLAASMLADHSEKLGNNPCNDWRFPEDWTIREKAEFCIAYHDWNGNPEEFNPEYLHLPDFAVAHFLAHMMEGSNDNNSL